MFTTLLPTQEELHRLFDYRDGELYWKPRDDMRHQWNGRFSNTPAGCVKDKSGYKRITINKTKYLYHRLVYAWHFGTEELDAGSTIDHINRDTTDNRIENLRLATLSEQLFNQPARGAIPYRGISFFSNKYVVRIQVNGVRQYLGRCETLEEAIALYDQHAKMLVGEFHQAQ